MSATEAPPKGPEKLIESPLSRLTDEQIEQLGKEFDAIHDEVFAELGDRDRKYITSMIEMHRRLLVLSRVTLFFSRYKPAWAVGLSRKLATTLAPARALALKGMARKWLLAMVPPSKM